MTPPAQSPRLPRSLLVVIAVGAVARLIPYLRRPSLSFDEAMLSVNIASRSLAGLLHPLDYDQTAPPLYLWLTKGVTLIGGVNEFALRALPLVAGLLLPWAVWRLARRFLPDGAALFAAAVVALAPGLVEYSAIVKPYAIDALITVLLLEAALEVKERDDARSWAWLIGLGAVAVCLSTPALFVLAAIGICLVIDKWRTRWALLALAALAWLGPFAAIYASIYRSAAAGQFMQRFWASDFLVPASFGMHGRAYGMLRNSFLEALLLRPSPWVVAIIFCVVALLGLTWIGMKRGWRWVWLLTGPVVMTAVASSFRRYPFSWRLLQFAVPLVALWLAAAGAWLTKRGIARSLAGVVLVLLAAVNVSHPYRTQPTRQLIADWRTRAAPHDPVYVFQGSVPAWAIYTTDWSHPDSAWLAGLAGVRATPGADLDLERAGRREIIGHYTGVDWFTGEGASRPHVDPAWAGHEVHRIRGLGRESGNIWLLFAQSYRDEVPSLVRALSDSGFVRMYADSAPGAALYGYHQ